MTTANSNISTLQSQMAAVQQPKAVGVATLSAGTATVSVPSITNTSAVLVSQRGAAGTTIGNIYEVQSVTAGVGFTMRAKILSTGLTGALDTSQLSYLVW